METPSVTKVEPMFELKNVFKPTSRNMIILGTMIKVIAAGIVTSCAPLFTSDIPLAIKTIVGGVIFGALGEGIILFSKEEPVSTLLQAAEDIKIEVAEQLADPTTPPIEQTHD